MDYQNVTITLPVSILREAKHLAVDRGVSLSRYVAILLQEHTDSQMKYGDAHRRQVALMREGLQLGTGGSSAWSRDELHER